MSYPYQIKSYEDYKTAWQKSVDDPEGFWGEIAETFSWQKKWDKVLSWNFETPDIKWFEGGK
jgi:acetyl-CoA synthetase